MVPKTERFELRLDPTTIDRIDAWRAEQGDLPSRSEAVRRLVETGLGAGAGSGVVVPISLGERLILGMLADVHKATKGPKESNPDFIMSSIYGGHYWALDWELQGLIHDHVDSRQDVTFVVDTLDMWTFIEEAAELLTEEEKKGLPRQPHFLGFDGNNETSLMSIAKFLVNDMDRFVRFKGRSLNSHSPTVSRYAEMIRVFEPIREGLIGRRMNVEELRTVLGAGR